MYRLFFSFSPSTNQFFFVSLWTYIKRKKNKKHHRNKNTIIPFHAIQLIDCSNQLHRTRITKAILHPLRFLSQNGMMWVVLESYPARQLLAFTL